MSQNPFAFVVGCNRSGTTLLERMLDHHPDLVMLHEVRFIPAAHRLAKGGASTSDLAEWLVEHRKFPVLELPESAIRDVAARTSTCEEFVSEVFSEVGRARGKPHAGEKAPGYVQHLSPLHQLFPWARFVHLIRDGRDVALSALEWEGHGPSIRYELWETEPTAVCALWWRHRVSSGLEKGKVIGPDRYREVSYEDLVARPAETLREICEFIDLPFAPQMLRFNEGKMRSNPNLSPKRAWLPPTQGLRDWRTQMAPREVELFESLAGEVLSSLGYERAYPSISAEIAQVAERSREQWIQERQRPHRRKVAKK